MRPREPAEPAPSVVDALLEDARAAERSSRHVDARARYEEALRGLPSGAPALASAILRWIGRTHESMGDFESALDCYEAALASAYACGADADVAHVLNCRGALMFRKGQLEEAERLYLDARTMAEEAGESKLVAMVDQNLGSIANIHGDLELARVRYHRSLERYQTLGLEEYVGPLLNNIGRLYTDLGDWHQARLAFRRALESCSRSGNVSHQVVIEVNQARLHLSTEDHSRARVACDDALELSMSLQDDRWLGEIHKQRGVILLASDRPRLAEASFKEALAEAVRREDLLLHAEVTREMAQLFLSEKRHPEVLECLKQAHEAFSRLRARQHVADVDLQITKLEESFASIVRRWGESIESKDLYTKGHCDRVATSACELAVAAGYDRHDLTWFRMGALLHDLGKVKVPSSVLNKPGRLTSHEWGLMQRHPEDGVQMLVGIDFPWDIRPMVLHHHERWSGGGYPHDLAGQEIPVAARILCVADVFDALTTTRSYRQAYTAQVALEIMDRDSGRVFDPEILALFKQIQARRRVRPRVEATPLELSVPRARSASSSRLPPAGAVA